MTPTGRSTWAQPTFKTPRLMLQPRTHANDQDCYTMDREPGVTRFVSGPWSEEGAHREFIAARTAGPYAEGQGYWTISLRNDLTRFLGWVLLIPADGIGPDIEIGWRLRPLAWGRGYATEAAGAILEHAYSTLRLNEIVADIHVDNLASQQVALKLGMNCVGSSPSDLGNLRYSLSRIDFGIRRAVHRKV